MTPVDRACRELHAEYVRTRQIAPLARANGVTQKWLKQRWRKLGLHSDLRRVDRERRAVAIAQDRAAGMTYDELCAKHHVTHSTVQDALRMHGLLRQRRKSPHPRGSETFRRGHLAAAA